MSKNYDVAEQMRAFAEQGMDQARKAFDSYMDTVQKTMGTIESSSNELQAKTTDASKKAMGLAEEHMSAAFSQAEKLVTAKDPQEALDLQTSYIREQIEAANKQASTMGEDAAKVMKDIQSSFNA